MSLAEVWLVLSYIFPITLIGRGSFNTPLTEHGIVEFDIGLASMGYRAVGEVQFAGLPSTQAIYSA